MKECVCGLDCSACSQFGAECLGGTALKGRVCWTSAIDTECCPIYRCAENKGLAHCGFCTELPCGIWQTLHDPAQNKEAFQESFQARIDALHKRTLKESDLLQIPGVGKTIAENLVNIGCPTVASLRGKDPEELYAKDCAWKGFQEDRCLLYVFRLAVYYAENETHEPDKLKWWNWKDCT